MQEAARAAFEALPEADRKAIQDALVWTGDQLGSVDGSFGRQTFEGIMSAQRKANLPPNGILDPRGRAALLAQAEKLRQAAGFAVVADDRTGVRIGVPARLLPKRDVNPNGGSRWQSADGKVTLDTRALPRSDLKQNAAGRRRTIHLPRDVPPLQALYERNLAIQTPGRQVTCKILRPDFFVIAGETAGGRYYSRYAAGGGVLRGFSFGYDKSLAKDFDRLAVAIANSFVPFPEAAAPTVPVAAAVAAPAQPPPATGPALLGSGLVVGPRRVVTTIALEGGPDPRVAGQKPRQARPGGAGLTIVEMNADLRADPIRVRKEPVADEPVLALAFAGAGEPPRLVVAPGTASDTSLSAPLQPGAGGAPLFDRSGALVGLVAPLPEKPFAVAGIVPIRRYPFVPAAALAAILSGEGRLHSAPDVNLVVAEGSAAGVAAARQAIVVPILCNR